MMLDKFECIQVSDTTVHFRAVKIRQTKTGIFETKILDDYASVSKQRYFDFNSMKKFIEDYCEQTLNPARNYTEKSTWKGIHNGNKSRVRARKANKQGE